MEDWFEFLDEEEFRRIKELAVIHSLGELDYYEWVYVDAKLAYNHAAESTSMDAYVARNLKECLIEMENSRSDLRVNKIKDFVNWLGTNPYADLDESQ